MCVCDHEVDGSVAQGKAKNASCVKFAARLIGPELMKRQRVQATSNMLCCAVPWCGVLRFGRSTSVVVTVK